MRHLLTISRGLGARLLIVVTVPLLIMCGLITVIGIDLANEENAADRVADGAGDIETMVNFQRALFDERIAAEILVKGGDPATVVLVSELLGAEAFPDAFAASAAAFDPTVLTGSSWERHLEARELVTNGQPAGLAIYEELDALLLDRISEETVAVSRQGAATGDVALRGRLDELEAALDASAASTNQATTLAAAWLEDAGDRRQVDRELESSAFHYEYARDQSLDRSPQLFDEVDLEALDSTVASGIEAQLSRELGAAPDFGVAIEVFRALLTRSRIFLDATSVASRQATIVANSRSDSASASFRGALIVGGLVVAATLALTTLLARSISRPIRRLAVATETLRTGHLDYRRLPVSGPPEIAAVTIAFNEVSDNLRALERKLASLSNAGASSADFADPLPGPLGETLDRSVDTLSSSIHEQSELRDSLAHQASHDPLTGALNRTGLLDALDAKICGGDPYALLFVDLDEFKKVNDSHGHAAGDHVLAKTAQRLLEVGRADDLVARLGGDEFVVVTDHSDQTGVAVLASRIRKTIQQPIEYRETVGVAIDASIGVAFSGDEQNALEILGRADAALYRAKQSGVRLAYFNKELKAELSLMTDLEHDLRTALRRGELMIHYQPVVSSATNATAKVEALARWQRTDGRFISPAVFVSVAEKSRLIVDLDCYVLTRATADIAKYNRVADEELRLSVNISGRHLVMPEFVDHVEAALESSRLDPAHLVIEVTETALVADTTRAADHLQQIRDMGVGVSLDDFGTGFTSISQLRSLPVDELKIDRSLVEGIGRGTDGELLRVVKDLANHFDYTTVAEGVETQAQADVLRDLGCNYLQGWLFAAAMPVEQLATWIETNGSPTSAATPTATR